MPPLGPAGRNVLHNVQKPQWNCANSTHTHTTYTEARGIQNRPIHPHTMSANVTPRVPIGNRHRRGTVLRNLQTSPCGNVSRVLWNLIHRVHKVPGPYPAFLNIYISTKTKKEVRIQKNKNPAPKIKHSGFPKKFGSENDPLTAPCLRHWGKPVRKLAIHIFRS